MSGRSGLDAAVRLAMLAPSVHNTQPWLFAVDADAVHVFVDRSRAAPAIDPGGRYAVLSCGAAVELLRLAIRSLDRTCAVWDFPDPADPDLVATLRAGPACPCTPHERALVAAVPRRHTHRGSFDDRPMPAGYRQPLSRVAHEHGVTLDWLDDAERMGALAGLLFAAEDQQHLDAAYREELHRWTNRPQGAADGVPRAALSSAALADGLPGRDFGQGRYAGLGRRPQRRAMSVLVMSTATDDAHAWLAAGQALAALWLEATLAGIAAQPLMQIIDVPATRERLRTWLGTDRFPQFVLRMGPGEPRQATPRRPVSDVIVDVRGSGQLSPGG